MLFIVTGLAMVAGRGCTELSPSVSFSLPYHGRLGIKS